MVRVALVTEHSFVCQVNHGTRLRTRVRPPRSLRCEHTFPRISSFYGCRISSFYGRPSARLRLLWGSRHRSHAAPAARVTRIPRLGDRRSGPAPVRCGYAQSLHAAPAAREGRCIMALSRSARRAITRDRLAREAAAAASSAGLPLDYAAPVTRDGIALAANPNRGKRGGAPLNWSRRTLTGDTLRASRAPDTILRTRPVLTPTGRRAKRNGEPRVTEAFTTPRDLRWIAREPN